MKKQILITNLGMAKARISIKLTAVLGFCAAFSLFFLGRSGALAGYDTLSYLSHCITRPPLYPLALDLFRLVSGSKYPAYLCIFQILLVLSSALYLMLVLTARHRLSAWVSAACFILLISPLYTERIGNYLLTEAIAYSLFLACAALVVKIIHSFEPRHFMILAALTAANSLVRLQMSFMYGVCFLLLFWQYFSTKSLKNILRPLLFIVLAAFAACLLECGYNLYFNGIFTKSKVRGLTMAKDALYVSNLPDATLFKNAGYYPAIERIYTEMDSNKLFSKYRHERDANLARYFASAISPQHPGTWRGDVIYWHILARQLYYYTAEDRTDPAAWDEASKTWGTDSRFYTNGKAWLKMNAIGFDIYRKILKSRLADYLKLTLSRLKNETSVFEVLLLAFLLILPFVQKTELNMLVSLIAAANVLNMLTVALTIFFIPRCTFYTYTLEVVALLLLFQQYLQCRQSVEK